MVEFGESGSVHTLGHHIPDEEIEKYSPSSFAGYPSLNLMFKQAKQRWIVTPISVGSVELDINGEKTRPPIRSLESTAGWLPNKFS